MTMRRIYRYLQAVLVLWGGLSLLPAATLPVAAKPLAIAAPNGFWFEAVVDGFDLPTAFAIAPDGRIFIAQKEGLVRVFHNGQLQEEPFIDLSNEVNATNERGLLGIAVHPRWQGRGIGRALIAFAEEMAQTLRVPELRLYTHVTMTENVALYGRLGFEETRRAVEDGYERVFMRKAIVILAQ